jgi:serine protease Do
MAQRCCSVWLRGWACCGAIAAGMMTAAVPAMAEVDREMAIRLSTSMVKIEVITERGYELGSGVIVAPNEVATNCHVTRRAVAIHALQRGLRLAVQRQAADIAHDVCLLRIDSLEGNPAQLGDAPDLQRGDALLAIGYTGGQGISYSEGVLVSRHRLDHSTVLRSSTFFNSGASGGGLFDAKGRLVGILTFRLRGADQHYFSVPVAWITELQRSSGRWLDVAPIRGETFWERTDDSKAPFLRAAELSRAAQWAALVALARRWIDADPLDAAASAALGEGLAETGDLPGAEKALARNVSLDPKDAEGWLKLGRIQLRLGRKAEAILSLARLRPLDTPMAEELNRLLQTR